MTDRSINGKAAIIAGGAKDLGGLIARDVAARGAKAIAMHYNSAATRAEATVAAIKAAGAPAEGAERRLSRSSQRPASPISRTSCPESGCSSSKAGG